MNRYRALLVLLASSLIAAAATGASERVVLADNRLQRDTVSFEPDGYYVPITRPAPPLANLMHLEVRTSGDGRAQDGRLPTAEAPIVTVTYKVTGGDEVTSECGQVRITRDSLSASCRLAAPGQAAFALAFLDSRGRFWELADYDEQVREVARGRVVTTLRGQPAVAQAVAFYYSAGH